MKRSLVLVLCLVGSLILASTVFAAESTGQNVGIMATQYITKYGCSIRDAGNNTVQMTGFTEANDYVDQISVTLYLQRSSDGNNWSTILSSKYTETDYNALDVDATTYESVAPGYYYRTKAVHQVVNDGYTESKISYSLKIHID
ncbi:MAG: hypothetical protein H0Z39_11630 [Peptococcaceae bacterium]|nr:hypothetical protein [Peptococcaceae bacterium]